jgi:acyl-homoserine lactone acylase PvdQ
VTVIGDWDNTVLALPVGQSGRPWSSHYADQVQGWLDGECRTFPFSDEAVDQATCARLRLVPAPEPE